jgi:hypothetical protein
MTDTERLKQMKADNARLKRRVTRLRSALVGLLDVAWPNEDDKLSRTNRAIGRARRALKG